MLQLSTTPTHFPVKAPDETYSSAEQYRWCTDHTLSTLSMQKKKKKECTLHCARHLPRPRCSRHLRDGSGSQPVASRPLGSHVTAQNIQLLPKSVSHNIHHCEPPPQPGSRSHGTLIGNQYGATQPRPKMPFWQNVLSH